MKIKSWGPFNPPQTANEWLDAVEEHKPERGRVALRLQQLKMPPDNGEPLKITDMTCMMCKHESYCDSAWDLYNTNGDCLEEK